MGDAPFPIVCETCLGDSAFVRMSQSPLGAACKICTRPFTLFRWKAGSSGRFKSTILCPACARLKHVCQTCVLDLKYGLPVEVRDGVVAAAGGASLVPPSSDLNLQHALSTSTGSHVSETAHDTLLRLGRERTSTLAHARNASKLCSFFAAGSCNRGDSCPYRHEMPREKDGLSSQHVRDRFAGVNDPVAVGVMARFKSRMEGAQAVDVTQTKLWMGGLPGQVQQGELLSALGEYGATPTSVHLHSTASGDTCAFLQYDSHDAAGAALQASVGRVKVRGVTPTLDWARPKKSDSSGGSGGGSSAAAAGAPVAAAAPAAASSAGGYPAGGGMDPSAYYAAMYAAMYAAAATAAGGGAGPDRSRAGGGASAVARAGMAAAGPHAYASMDPTRMGADPSRGAARQ